MEWEIDNMKCTENITEELKAKDMMAWAQAQAMNSIRDRAIIYNQQVQYCK